MGGIYLRRGIDRLTAGGVTTTVVRHQQYVENDEVCEFSTVSLNKAGWTWSANDQKCNLILLSMIIMNVLFPPILLDLMSPAVGNMWRKGKRTLSIIKIVMYCIWIIRLILEPQLMLPRIL